jgi:hypothetical protein
MFNLYITLIPVNSYSYSLTLFCLPLNVLRGSCSSDLGDHVVTGVQSRPIKSPDMAANYWTSTQRRHWLFSREKLAEIRDALREKDKAAHSQFPLPDQRLLNIYFNQRGFR